MCSDLMDVLTAVELSRATIKNIKENLSGHLLIMFWELCRLAGIDCIFGGTALNPMIAGAASEF